MLHMCCKLMFVRLLSMCSLDGERACCTELGFMLQPESRGFVEALSTNTYLCSPYPWIIPVWLIKIWELMVWNVWSVPGMSMAKCRAFGPWTSWKKTRLVIGKWRAWRLARISSRCLSSSVNFWVWNQRWHHCQHIDWWWLVNAMLRKAPSMPCTSSTDIRVWLSWHATCPIGNSEDRIQKVVERVENPGPNELTWDHLRTRQHLSCSVPATLWSQERWQVC